MTISDDNDPLEKGDPAKIADDGHTGEYIDQLRLNNQVIDFAE